MTGLRRFVGAPTAVQATGWGYVSVAVCFTCRTLEPDRAIGLVGSDTS